MLLPAPPLNTQLSIILSALERAVSLLLAAGTTTGIRVRVFILLQVKVNMYYTLLRGLVGNRASIFPRGKLLYTLVQHFTLKPTKPPNRVEGTLLWLIDDWLIG